MYGGLPAGYDPAPEKPAAEEFVEVCLDMPEVAARVDRLKGVLKVALDEHVERIRAVVGRRVAAITTLVALFTSTVVVTNAVSGNLIHVGPFLFVAGTLSYPLTFLLTDILSEVFGREHARRAVHLGFIAQVLSVLFILGVMQFDSLNAQMGESFRQVFGQLSRITLASMAAYIVAQTVDVYLFHYIKKKTQGRWLWLRNNVASCIAQGFDTAIFVLVAFAGTLSARDLMVMFAGQYVVKAMLAILDTPFCYLGVHITRRYLNGKSV